MPSYAVLIRGPLGVGKTTVARTVAAALGAGYVSIDRILDEPGVEQWTDDRIPPESFLEVNRRALERSAGARARGRAFVFDGNFYYQVQIDDLVQRLGVPSAIVTLCAPLAVCVARDAGRATSLGAGAARDVFAMVAGVDAGVPVDATGSVADTVAAVLRAIRDRVPAGPTRSRARPRPVEGARRGATGPRSPRARGRRR